MVGHRAALDGRLNIFVGGTGSGAHQGRLVIVSVSDSE
jgi:hypothetical protein